jgi:hypothetical protein
MVKAAKSLKSSLEIQENVLFLQVKTHFNARQAQLSQKKCTAACKKQAEQWGELHEYRAQHASRKSTGQWLTKAEMTDN